MLLSHEGDPNWHVLMRHTYHMRTVIGGEAIRELSTPSQCPPASCVADCCVGRRLMSNFAQLLEDGNPTAVVIGRNYLSLLAGILRPGELPTLNFSQTVHNLPTRPCIHHPRAFLYHPRTFPHPAHCRFPGDGEEHAVIENALSSVATAISRRKKARIHLYAVFVPGSDNDQGEGQPEGHWCHVAVHLTKSGLPKSFHLRWPAMDMDVAPPCVVQALSVGLARVYRRLAVDVHLIDSRALAIAAGDHHCLQQTNRYDCGVITALSLMCDCRAVDALVSQGDTVVLHTQPPADQAITALNAPFVQMCIAALLMRRRDTVEDRAYRDTICRRNTAYNPVVPWSACCLPALRRVSGKIPECDQCCKSMHVSEVASSLRAELQARSP